MANAIVPFSFETHEVRVVLDDSGEPLFVAKDLVEAVDAVWKGESSSLSHVPDEWKLARSVRTSHGTKDMICLTEQGMYFYLIRSDKPKALPLQKQVSGEVLPSIRKTGKYSVEAQPTTAIPAAAEFQALFNVARLIGLDTNAAAISANQGAIQLTGTNVLALLGQTHLPAEQQILWFTPTELGKNIDVSARQLNLLLAEAGLQHNEDGKWIPSAKADGLFRIFDTGKKHNSGTPVQQVKWAREVLDHIKPLPLVA